MENPPQQYFSRQYAIRPTKVDMKKHKLDDKFKFLSGTDMWVQFDIQDDSGFQKSIHYFSDRHSLEGNCPKYLKCKTTDTRIPRRGGLRKRDYTYFQSPCYDFLYFLEKMFEDALENKVYMDLFLEYPYNILKKDDQEYQIIKDSYLTLVYDKFHNCFTLQKKNCKYSPYVRVHYTDLRLSYDALDRIVSSTEIVTDVMTGFLENISESQHLTKPDFANSFLFVHELFKFNYQHGYDIFEILLTKDNYEQPILSLFQKLEDKISKLSPTLPSKLISTYRQYILDLISLHKVRNKKKIFIAKHQIDELRKDNVLFQGKNIADLITKNILETRKVVKEQYEVEAFEIWKKVAQKYNTLVSNWNNENMSIFIDTMVDAIEELTGIAVAIDAIMLDAYILPRMFRKFTTHPSSLTFVLAGSGHIQFEVDFFKNVLGVRPLHDLHRVEGTKQCLYYKDFWKVFDIRNYESAKIKYYPLLTIQEIKKILKDREIKGYSHQNKDKLISVLRNDDKKKVPKNKYEQLTVQQLIQEFKKLNLRGYSGKKKQELIDILMKTE
jgi:hypothetical protein